MHLVVRGRKASACISCDVSCMYCVTALISGVQCCCLEGVVRADMYPHQVWAGFPGVMQAMLSVSELGAFTGRHRY